MNNTNVMLTLKCCKVEKSGSQKVRKKNRLLCLYCFAYGKPSAAEGLPDHLAGYNIINLNY